MISLIVILVIGFVAAFWVIGAYNGLVRGRNEVKSAWSSIEVQLKRRYDLIPNLLKRSRATPATSARRWRLLSMPGSRPSALPEAWRKRQRLKMLFHPACVRSLLWPRPTRSLRPTRTSSPFRKNWPARRTRSVLHGNIIMTRQCGIRIGLKFFRVILSPICSLSSPRPFSRLTQQKKNWPRR